MPQTWRGAIVQHLTEQNAEIEMLRKRISDIENLIRLRGCGAGCRYYPPREERIEVSYTGTGETK